MKKLIFCFVCFCALISFLLLRLIDPALEFADNDVSESCFFSYDIITIIILLQITPSFFKGSTNIFVLVYTELDLVFFIASF